jgi:hypothetical protein
MASGLISDGVPRARCVMYLVDGEFQRRVLVNVDDAKANPGGISAERPRGAVWLLLGRNGDLLDLLPAPAVPEHNVQLSHQDPSRPPGLDGEAEPTGESQGQAPGAASRHHGVRHALIVPLGAEGGCRGQTDNQGVVAGNRRGPAAVGLR